MVLNQLRWTMKLYCQASLKVIPRAVTSTRISLPVDSIFPTHKSTTHDQLFSQEMTYQDPELPAVPGPLTCLAAIVNIAYYLRIGCFFPLVNIESTRLELSHYCSVLDVTL